MRVQGFSTKTSVYTCHGCIVLSQHVIFVCEKTDQGGRGEGVWEGVGKGGGASGTLRIRKGGGSRNFGRPDVH